MAQNSIILSQNFLKDPALVSKLITVSGIDKNDVVYEIGAGKGLITKELSKKCKRVISIEYDIDLFEALKQELNNYQNVELLNQDFLKIKLPDYEYKVFSNIPFNITSDIVSKLVFSQNSPASSHLIMQKEAAQRFTGIGEGKLISLLIEPFFALKIDYTFSKSDFTPAPSVDTVLFSITRRTSPLIDPINAKEYRNFIVFALNQQKPSLKLRLNKIFTSNQFYKLSKDLKFNLDATTQDLNFEQWLGLFKYYLSGVESSKKDLIKNAETSYFLVKNNQNKVHRTKIHPF